MHAPQAILPKRKRPKSRAWLAGRRALAGCALAIAACCSARADEPSDVEPQADPSQVERLPADAPPSPADLGSQVDFATQIQPILARHCQGCHGSEKHRGGLQLDSREHASRGGDSRQPILGGTLETNELYRRVASPDRTVRMPKNAEALSEAELATIKRWVEQGTSWPGPQRSGDNSWWFDRFSVWLTGIEDRYRSEVSYARPFVFAFLAAQLALLAVARVRAAYLGQRSWTRVRAPRLCRFCGELRPRELTLAWLLSAVLLGMAVMHGHGLRMADDMARFEASRMKNENPWSRTVYGFPPVPIRPGHPRQIAGVYYRGNCERNPELFNGGNYLTSTFRISLRNARHETANVGDPVGDGGLLVHLEIERAPGTADALFSKDLMASVFLSRTFFDGVQAAPDDDLVRLTTREEGQRWEADVPLGQPDESGGLQGLIYLYTGHVEGGKVSGDPHYGIKYDLQIQQGKLAETSDLWMSSFGNEAVATPSPAGKIPFREWFDYRPIPPIVGENTKNPKLLGVEEYIRKGLIKPDQDAPRDGSAPADPAQREPDNKKPDRPQDNE